ncbi:MAG TPA: 4Fe-4S dicluster domain-containing protein [Acidobacteriota bacterium]|nr:4Fe-4S dicluster domain-containing protein [Acidobacteriota bacterium]HNT17889.1 4Fe-4S dicluster domain-containing protein [Acidobacteriota bacterium]HPA27529.1 4Fe-4S dicluster domain-containing protein [Acidobacteriota bacterium]HQO20370.1 4Fe-4S dicluster domain-containing protein [Acidobacteriota bacterium]
MEYLRTVKYESELDKKFLKEVVKHSECDKILECIQCGTCSSTCPVSLYMDYTPRKLMAMIKGGFKDDALKSKTVWICSSCYSCTVMCPAQIKITDVMYALKRMAIEKGVYSKGIPTPVLAQEMSNIISRKGRNSEMEVVTRMMLRTNPFGMLKMAPMGMSLFFKGRMEIFGEKIKNLPQMRKLLKGLKEAK